MPYFGSTLFVASLVAMFLVSLGGAALLASALFPRAVEAIGAAEARRPVGAVLVGAPIFAVLTGLALALLNGPPLARVVGALLAVAGTTLALVGLAATSQRVGAALAPSSSSAGQVLRGAVVIELAALLPLFGWFVILPLALAAGLGGAAFALFRERATVAGAAIASATSSSAGLGVAPAGPVAMHEAPRAWEPGGGHG